MFVRTRCHHMKHYIFVLPKDFKSIYFEQFLSYILISKLKRLFSKSVGGAELNLLSQKKFNFKSIFSKKLNRFIYIKILQKKTKNQCQLDEED